jgi:hypothetical protein
LSENVEQTPGGASRPGSVSSRAYADARNSNESAVTYARDAASRARQAKYLAKQDEIKELAKALESLAKAVEALARGDV